MPNMLLLNMLNYLHVHHHVHPRIVSHLTRLTLQTQRPVSSERFPNQFILSTVTLSHAWWMNSRLRMSSRTECNADMESSDEKHSEQEEEKQDDAQALLLPPPPSSSSSSRLPSLVNDEKVAFDELTTEEKKIYRLHKEASDDGQSSYTDPATGYIVLTQQYHIARGKCCGSACRHCPYGHVNVPEKYRTKTFNTAFYV